MGEIIRTWLQGRLGLLFEDQSWDQDRGGGVLANLLNSYMLLSDEQLKIILSKIGELYEPTIEVMRLRINNLGIRLSKEEFREVIDAKGTAPSKLFYELFLVLHGKDSADFIITKKLKEPIKSSRFSVTTHDEVNEITEEITVRKFSNPLAASLTGKEEVVKYHINKYLELMKKCKQTRDDYTNFFENRRLSDNDKSKMMMLNNDKPCTPVKKEVELELPSTAESLNQSMSELYKEQKRAEQLQCIQPDENVSKKIITSLQLKARNRNKNRGMRDTFRKQILKDLWDRLMEEQEDYFKHQFMEKLQQQSMYEQQMTTSLMNLREQRHEIADQKRDMMMHIRKQQEETMIQKLFDEEHKQDQERYDYYVERNRKLLLHRKLYEEKVKRLQEESRSDCENIVNDIVDMAFYHVDYTETNCNSLPRRKRDDLARLFIKQQPIFDLLQDVTDIINPNCLTSYDSSEDIDMEVEPITMMELDRQNTMDDLTFDDYHNYKWPWDYNSWMEYDKYKEMWLGLNVLGHVVHRLLLMKYPRKALPSTPAVPRKSIAVCLDGLHNLDVLPALEQLLHARKVKIIQMVQAMEYCLEVFKNESTVEYLGGVFDDATQQGLDDLENAKKSKPSVTISLKGSKRSSKTSKSGKDKKSVGDKKDKGRKKSQSKVVIDASKPTVAITCQDKINQTPKLFPDEEMLLSDAGNVGKNLFEVMNLGELPNEQLNAAAFVEYLKSLNFSEIEGWVLVNYPQTIQQAVVLEEALSCTRIPAELRVFPPDSVGDLVDLESRPGLEDSSWDDKRVSKIVPTGKGSIDDGLDYDTFLTAFIELRTEGKDDPDEKLYDCFKSPENMAALCRFYQEQGCKYTLYYDKIDFDMIKHLGKVILGDWSVPPKDSETLFTDTVYYVEANFEQLVSSKSTPSKLVKVGEKVVRKSKESKPAKTRQSEEKTDKNDKKEKKSGKSKDKLDTKSKKDSKSKKSKSKISVVAAVDMEDEETQIPTPKPEPEESLDDLLPPAMAGEYRWIYHDLPIMPYYEDALATLWENIEDVYVTDMKQLFFRRRTIMDALIPYNTYVKNNLLEFISRPDIKQKYLTEFQLVYNEFEEDMREDDEVKCELHMRIEEFREKLWKICDDRLRENEDERCRIVGENWITTQLMELCNIYIDFLQLEVDRSVDTCQLLVDYYSAMITGGPCRDQILKKIKFEIIPLPKSTEDFDHVAPFVEFTENMMKKVSAQKAPNARRLSGVSAHSEKSADSNLKQQKSDDFEDLTDEDNPFLNKFKLCMEQAQQKLEDNLKSCVKVKDNLEMRFNPQKAKSATRKDKKDKKSKKDKSTVANSEASQIIEPEEDAKESSLQMLQELDTSTRGEYYRCKLRLDILLHVFAEEMHDMLEKGGGSFEGLYKFIEQHYKGEIHAVDQAAKLLKRAVEEETSIQPEMLLDNDMFYVKLGSLMYESPLPDDDSLPVKEISDDEKFTITQLGRIADVLLRLAPTGVMPAKAFAFLLQEFLVFRGEDGEEEFVPKVWKRLPTFKIQTFMMKLFGDSEYVDCKDFIIYGLDLRFPTEKEILTTRRQFRELDPDMTEFVFDYQYSQVKFWFEDVPNPNNETLAESAIEVKDNIDPLRVKLIRDLLFRLFSQDNHRLNYTSLLLFFCKDTNPVLGLAKALAVSLGKFIVYDETRGSIKYAKSLKKIITRDLEHISKIRDRVDTENISKEVVDKLIDDTIHCTNSVVINVLDEGDSEPLCCYDILQYLNSSGKKSAAIDNVGELFEHPSPNPSEYEYSQCGELSVATQSQAFVAKDAAEYQVAFDVLINIFTVMMPWLHKIKSFGQMTFHERFAMLYNSLINEDIRVAYVYQIFTHADFLRMFNSFYKYYDRRLVDIVRQLLEDE